jgi:hypothetical protein
MLNDNNVNVIYSGPIWANGIDGLAEMLIKRLEFDDLPFTATQAVFSIFIEQINNMMMYSAEKDKKNDAEGNLLEISKGVFILGVQGTSYFIQSGNLVTNYSAGILKERIDHLNTLDKKELRRYHKERLKAENDNPESQGAGIGLIEVARRSSSPIEYEFEPHDDERQHFTMYITVQQGGEE